MSLTSDPTAFPPTNCDGTVGMDFYGATVSVTLAANQTIDATATASVGGGSAPVTTGLFMNMCYQQTAPAGGALVLDDAYFGPLSAAKDTLMPVSLTKSFAGLLAGTYTVGMCACVDGTNPTTSAWAEDYSWINVRVFQQ